MSPRGVATLALILLAPSAVAAQPTPERADLGSIARLVDNDRLASAEDALRGLLSAEESAAARDLLGVVLGKRDRPQEAEEQFLAAVDLDPDYGPAHQHLARLYLVLDRAEEALVHLRAAADLGTLERELALRLASLESAAGNLPAAQRQWRAVADRYDSVRGLLELARIRSSQGEHEIALADLRRALAIAPNSEDVLSAHARVSIAAGAPIPAIWTLEQLARMHPAIVDYAYLLGVARMQVGEMGGAVEALERALSLQPERPLSLIALGIALNGQKRFDEAKEVLARSLLVAPESGAAFAALAEAEEGLGELEAAERHARRALARGEAHPRAHLVIGLVRMSQERYSEAIESLRRTVEADPSSTKAHYQLSLAYARLGDRESSSLHLGLYREALEQAEERLIELRTRTGEGAGGMSS
jgi:tetratricopeptide (TPR) repeat protein